MATLQGAANGELPTGTTGADSLTGRGVNRVWTSRPAPTSSPARAAGLARATRMGEHLHAAFDGGELHLAFTTLDDLTGHGLPA